MGNYPQNTMLSFKKAIEQGAQGIEIDVHLSKDGELVVIHDETLDRTTNGNGFVKDFTLDQLKKFDAGRGEQIPTLLELYQLLSGTGIELNIELKTYLINYEDIEKKLLAVTEKYGEGRKVVYSSFHLPSILRTKQLDSSADIAWLLGGMPFLPHPADYIETLGLEALHLSKDMILGTPEQYRGVYDRIRVWTVNDAEDMGKLAGMGVNAIITDFPDRAVKFKSK